MASKQTPKKIDPEKTVDIETSDVEKVGEPTEKADIPTVEVVATPAEEQRDPAEESNWIAVGELSDKKATVEAANALTHGHQKKGVLLRVLVRGKMTGQIIFVDGAKVTSKGILK